MKIILDAMGGDHAPEAPVLGAIEAAKLYGAQITLVGRGEAILEVLRKHNISDLPTGVEGYVESTASGYLAAVAMAARLQGREIPNFPKETAIGALGLYISDSSIENFQPMNVNFSIIQPLEKRIRKKAEKNLAIANRSLEVIEGLKANGL